MKKRVLFGIAVISIMTAMSGCGGAKNNQNADNQQPGQPIIDLDANNGENTDKQADEGNSKEQYISAYNALDYVTLGEYKGLSVSVDNPEATDELVEQYVKYILQTQPLTREVKNRKLQLGDVANIDYVGKLDGVAFEGGTSSGYDLTIGSGQFISGFEDGCIGMEIGEVRDVEATFPDPYHSEELAGKTAIFTVTLNAITESVTLEEPTEEYVKQYGIPGVNTVDGFYAYLKDELASQLNDNNSTEIIRTINSNCEFSEPPAPVVDRVYDVLLKNMQSYQSMYGSDIGELVSYYYGGTAEEYEDTLRNEAKLYVNEMVMINAIASNEGIEITDDEYKKMLEESASENGYEVSKYESLIDTEEFKQYVLTDKVKTFLLENNELVAK